MAKPVKKEKKQYCPPTKDIAYHQITVECACGASFKTGSTASAIRVDICRACHPFYTGTNRILDAEGRVEKFRKKYNIPA